MVKLFPFNLEFSADNQGRPFFASFPFMFDGVPVEGISCGLSSRFAGDMAYSVQNPARLALLKAVGLDPVRVYGLTQIHSRQVLAVDRQRPPDIPADGMVSGDRQISLSITAADCLPVYLLDTETGAFGLLHSGWRGTGIAVQALKCMAKHWGTKPEAIAAVLGPCLDSCCYKVDEERAVAFDQKFGAVLPELAAKDAALFKPVTRREERMEGVSWYLDLKAANIRLLAASGVRNIAVCGDCTFTDERLGSFRREGREYTRMAALCGRLRVLDVF
ncbi:MAG: polyphenol oxidase family protein [Treponema sp.]|nr:polyphenol oxidase family protein [Treponema sp.]